MKSLSLTWLICFLMPAFTSTTRRDKGIFRMTIYLLPWSVNMIFIMHPEKF